MTTSVPWIEISGRQLRGGIHPELTAAQLEQLAAIKTPLELRDVVALGVLPVARAAAVLQELRRG